jgi:4-amino-4-deoxy-L-arabinose transferase-like glycosyltransferase
MIFTKPLQYATLLVLLINAAAMLSPIINSGDAVTYAAISQHIVHSGDWARLIWDGADWLDKPHFPFWVTALFFKLGGVNAWTYALPGFLFHLLGAYFTYRVARLFYNKNTALLSVLFYVSIYNLMDSSVEIKAEAYLTGQIMAASYYWLRYDATSRAKYLLLGALFTGMAVMTKGVFTLITVFGGIGCLLIYRRTLSVRVIGKWLFAALLSVIFAAPELIALHIQFDDPLHAFKFFFWDSQFGRFFNTGPIQNHNGSPFYFVPVFLYGFLPWTPVFFAAVWHRIKTFKQTTPAERAALTFLAGMFVLPFLMFSATSFQMAYYIDIILPFAAIFCADYLYRVGVSRGLFIAQMGMCVLLWLLVAGIGIYVSNTTLTIATLLALAALFGGIYTTRKQPRGTRALLYPALSISLTYGFLMLMTALTFMRVSIPYNAIQLLKQQPDAPVYVLQMPETARELCLYSRAPCQGIDALTDVTAVGQTAYLIVRREDAQQLNLSSFEKITSMELVVHKTGTFNRLLRLAQGSEPLETIDFLKLAPPP